MGERILSFWLEAERFQRHIEREQRRSVFCELQEKYLKSGSPLELPEIMKWKVLCGGTTNVNKDLFFRFQQRFPRAKDKAGSSISSNNVFREVQAMILDRLSSYWLPKYILHRAIVRQRVSQKWRQSVPLKGAEDESGGHKSVAGVVLEVLKNQKQVEEQAKQSANLTTQQEIDEFMENSRVSSAESVDEQGPADAEKERLKRLDQWWQWFWGPVDGNEGEVLELLPDLPPSMHKLGGVRLLTEKYKVMSIEAMNQTPALSISSSSSSFKTSSLKIHRS